MFKRSVVLLSFMIFIIIYAPVTLSYDLHDSLRFLMIPDDGIFMIHMRFYDFHAFMYFTHFHVLLWMFMPFYVSCHSIHISTGIKHLSAFYI